MIVKLKGYEEKYSIDTCGNVYSNDQYVDYKQRDGTINKRLIKGRKLKPCLSGRYPQVCLYTDVGTKTSKVIHRLVYENFVGEIVNVINHIDGDKTNNNIENLEDVTQQRNVEHGISKIYKLISPEGELVEIFNLSKFIKEKGFKTNSAMYDVANKKRGKLSYKGWKCQEAT